MPERAAYIILDGLSHAPSLVLICSTTFLKPSAELAWYRSLGYKSLWEAKQKVLEVLIVVKDST